MYTYYAFLKDAFVERGWMHYLDIDLFFLQFVVRDLTNNINARFVLWNVLDFSEIRNEHFSNFARNIAELHAEKVGYLTEETKGDLIV